jgi:hypothetical protein
MAYHRFIQEPDIAEHLRKRRTSVEPLFDLVAKMLGTTVRQKQRPVQRLENVRTCLALTTLTVQIAMLVNSIWGLPLRNVSAMIRSLPRRHYAHSSAKCRGCGAKIRRAGCFSWQSTSPLLAQAAGMSQLDNCFRYRPVSPTCPDTIQRRCHEQPY